MSAVVMISGALYRAPEAKVSKAGKPYAVATLKSREGEGALFWRLTAFSETVQSELMRLRDGDHLSVTGYLTPGIYQPEGSDPRLSLSIVVDQCVALKPKPKQKPERDRPKTPYRGGGMAVEEAGLNDPPPW